MSGLEGAGTAVGIVSLGIQVAQGLLKYYGAWKDYDEHISNLCASLSNLSEILDTLLQAIKTPVQFNETITEVVEKNIKYVKNLVQRLEAELSKFQSASISTPDWRSMTRRHIRRALYPFKEETLNKIERAVADARQNLDLAQQALQLQGISAVHQSVLTLVRGNQDKETQRILDWLSPKNFWLQQADISNQRQPGTGETLLHHPKFLEWVEGKTETIWFRGGPGAGKTILASTIINYLETDLSSQGIGFAFIYCDHKSKLSQTTEYFIGAIVRQIVERKRVIPEIIRTLYSKHYEKGTKPTLQESLDALKSLAVGYHEVYIVVDALDECVDMSGKPIWIDLLTKLKDSVPNLYLLYTSRDIDDAAGILSKSSLIDVRASNMDIENYIRQKYLTMSPLVEFCKQDPMLEERIMQEVVAKADGMFLAARLHIESLASKTNLRAIKRALDRLPVTLDASYDEAMTRIKQQPTESLALRILLWAVYAVRPLQLEELQHAIAIAELEPEDKSIPNDCLTPHTIIINVCAGLIRVEENSNIVRLVHITAQDYFDRKGTNHFPNAHADIGNECLRYLTLEVFHKSCSSTKEVRPQLWENPLLKYAAFNLGAHINKNDTFPVSSAFEAFFIEGLGVQCAAQVLCEEGHRWYGSCENLPMKFDGIHFASLSGLESIVRLLAAKCDVDLETKDSFYRTPLHLAAMKGHEAVIKELLSSGRVDVNSRDSFGHTPLYIAVLEGHKEVVRRFLDCDKVDVNAGDYLSLSPLCIATFKGDEAIVRMLLDNKKVDINGKSSFSQTPLSFAAINGYEVIMKMLLDAGSGVDASEDETRILRAAKDGCEVVAELLFNGPIKVKSDFNTMILRSLCTAPTREIAVLFSDGSPGEAMDVKTLLGRTLLMFFQGDKNGFVVKMLLDTGKQACRVSVSNSYEFSLDGDNLVKCFERLCHLSALANTIASAQRAKLAK